MAKHPFFLGFNKSALCVQMLKSQWWGRSLEMTTPPGGGSVYPNADLKELDGFEAGFNKPVEMADGYGFNGAKAHKDSKLCLMMLANFMHAKCNKTAGNAFSSMCPGCIAESPLFGGKRTWFQKHFPIFMKFVTGGFVGEHEAGQQLFQGVHDPCCAKSGVCWSRNGGPREGGGAEAIEKGGQISGGGGVGGGWDSIFENDQSSKVLNIDIGLMEMMLAGVKNALTRQQFRVPQDLSKLAAALFKGWISKQWIDRQQCHIGHKAATKNNALNGATTVIDCFFTQWLKVWDQRNLDRHGHDHLAPRTSQQVERRSVPRDHTSLHICGSSP